MLNEGNFERTFRNVEKLERNIFRCQHRIDQQFYLVQKYQIITPTERDLKSNETFKLIQEVGLIENCHFARQQDIWVEPSRVQPQKSPADVITDCQDSVKLNIFVQRKLAKEFIPLKDFSEQRRDCWETEELRGIFDQIRKVYELLKGKEGLRLELENFFIRPEDLEVKLATFGLLGEPRPDVTIDGFSIRAFLSLQQQVEGLLKELVPSARQVQLRRNLFSSLGAENSELSEASGVQELLREELEKLQAEDGDL